METVISNYISIFQPNETLLDWCRTNLVMYNPKYYTAKNLGFKTDGIPKILNIYEYNRTKDILNIPFGLLKNVYSAVKNEKVKLDFADDEQLKVDYNCDIKDFGLYDYQVVAVNELIKQKFGILRSKAGSGKTQIGIALITQLGCKALWITHTKELLKQSYDRAAEYIDKSMLGTITEGKTHIGSGITFATVQTLANINLSELRKEWGCIIVDECHRVAGSADKLMRFSYVLNSLAAKHKYGLTATLHRSDGLTKTIYAYIGPIAYDVPEEAVKDKIMDVCVVPRETDLKLPKKCYRKNGQANFNRITDYITEHNKRNLAIVEDLKSARFHHNLVLSTRIEHLKLLMEMMPDDLKDKCVMISGKATNKIEKEKRQKAIEQMKSGEKLFLFATYSLAKEGLDIPILDRLYLTVPQSDYSVIIQSVGRIARVCQDKLPPVAYDYVDNDTYMMKKFKKRCEHYTTYGYSVIKTPFAEKCLTM